MNNFYKLLVVVGFLLQLQWTNANNVLPSTNCFDETVVLFQPICNDPAEGTAAIDLDTLVSFPEGVTYEWVPISIYTMPLEAGNVFNADGATPQFTQTFQAVAVAPTSCPVPYYQVSFFIKDCYFTCDEPDYAPTVELVPVTIPCEGTTVQLQAILSDNVGQFSWSNSSSIFDAKSTEPVTTVGPGTYTINVTSSFGCTSSATYTVEQVPPTVWYYDNDGDGLGDPNNSISSCTSPTGTYVTNGDDDNDNCVGSTDACGVCNGSGPTTWYQDIDGDGLGNPAVSQTSCTQPEGYVANGNDDCDGTLDCNGVCNGSGVMDVCGVCNGPGYIMWYADADGDGLGDPEVAFVSCTQPDGYVSNSDDDCDGTIDCYGICNGPYLTDECGVCNGTGPIAWFQDADGDGWGNPNVVIIACTQPDGYVANGDDLNDGVACNGPIDACGVCEGPGPITWYQDADGDLWGNPNVSIVACTQPDGYVNNNDDTNDLCAGVTDDCGICNGSGPTTWYQDADGDGLGNPNVSVIACTQPDGYVSNNNDDCDGYTDCAGVCGGSAVTDDCGVCNGSGPTTWYQDADGDGLGNPNVSVIACTQPDGYVANNDDACDGYTDCAGVCGGSAVTDACGVCNGPGPTTWYQDADGDLWGNPNVSIVACTQPDGYVNNNDDTNDLCAGVTDDCGVCNGSGPTTWYQDADGDGLGNPNISVVACTPPNGYVSNSDDDCDGYVDCNGVCGGSATVDACGVCDGPGYIMWYYDGDGDGLGDPEVAFVSCSQPAGYVDNNDDTCDAGYDCNGVCDGSAVTDECGVCGGTGPTAWFQDADGDLWGNPNVVIIACTQPDGYVANGDDLDDTCAEEVDICGVCGGPGYIMWYYDGDGDGLGDPEVAFVSCTQPDGYVDNNDDTCDAGYDCNNVCGGSAVTDECGVCNGSGPSTWYQDADGDGLGNPNVSVAACTQPNGYVPNNGDNNDSCNGTVDACGVCNGSGPTTWYQDADGDGLGNPNVSVVACTQPDGYVPNNNDNDDGCSGTVDACGVCNGSGPSTWYQDADGDGWGNPNVSITACTQPDGYVPNGDDLNDNCDGTVDACGVCNGSGPTTWYYDGDGDGLGNPNISIVACTQPNGYVPNNGDNDDSCNGAVDICGVCNGSGPTTWYIDADGDGLGSPTAYIVSCLQPDGYVSNNDDDNDSPCDGVVDACGVCNGPGPQVWYEDADGDFWGNPNVSVIACTQPDGYVDNGDDLDDGISCNGPIDICGVCEGPGPSTWYYDADSDGLGDPNMPYVSCEAPASYVGNNSDANDSDPTNSGGCDGVIDECGVCNGSGPQPWYQDADGDLWGNPNIFVIACSPPPGYVGNGDDLDEGMAIDPATYTQLPWIQNLIYGPNPCCNASNIILIQAPYGNFVFVQASGDCTSVLYTVTGSVYCTGDFCYDFYNLGTYANTPLWSCSPAEVGIDDYPWIADVFDLGSCCPGSSITEHDFGAYSFIYYSPGSGCSEGPQMYYQDGTFYCGAATCYTNYGLGNVPATTLWTCAASDYVYDCGTNYVCTEPLTPVVICPDFCSINGTYTIEVTEGPVYGGSVMALNNGCIQYIPSASFVNGSIDNFSLEACNFDGPCSTIEYIVSIDSYCNSPYGLLSQSETVLQSTPRTQENARRVDERVETENPIVAYPNPNNGQFTLQLPKDYDSEQFIQVFSANGQELEQYVIPFGDDVNSLEINLIDHPKGVYLIRWKGPFEAYNLKVVVN